MTITETDIANQALLALGELTIDDIDTGTNKRATTMKALYEIKRNYLLRKYDWKFAIKRITLYVAGSKITFTNQVGVFTLGNTVAGNTSGASGTIAAVYQDGSAGWIRLTGVSGTFLNNEVIYETAVGSELITAVKNRDFSGAAPDWANSPTNPLSAYNEVDDLTIESDGLYEYCSIANSYLSTLAAEKFYVFEVTGSSLSGTSFDLRISPAQIIIASLANGSNIGRLLLEAGFSVLFTLLVYSSGVGGITLDDFSVKEITNAAITGNVTALTPLNEFDYAYPLPSDYIRLIELYPDYIKYRIESNYILCGESDELDIRYIYKVTNPDEFDAAFIEAFAALLAREGAISLTDSMRKQAKMDELFEDKIADARFSGSIEDDLEEVEADDWLEQRF